MNFILRLYTTIYSKVLFEQMYGDLYNKPLGLSSLSNLSNLSSALQSSNELIKIQRTKFLFIIKNVLLLGLTLFIVTRVLTVLTGELKILYTLMPTLASITTIIYIYKNQSNILKIHHNAFKLTIASTCIMIIFLTLYFYCVPGILQNVKDQLNDYYHKDST